MAITYRDMLNRVMTALGESTISSSATELSSDYEKMVGRFINEIKEEVEDAFNWRCLRTRLTATITANTNTATLTGANNRSRVYRAQQSTDSMIRALCFDVTNATDPDRLMEMDLPELLYKREIDTDSIVTDSPSFFAVDDSAGADMTMEVWPTPTSDRNIAIHMMVPQARIGDTELDTVIAVPARPIELGAIWAAMEERGEELGTSGRYSQEKYLSAMDDAISRDAAEQGGMDLVIS